MYAKNDQYKVVDLEFGKNDPSYPSIDILIFDYNKLKIGDDMKITYDEKSFKVSLKTACAKVIKAHHLKKIHIWK